MTDNKAHKSKSRHNPKATWTKPLAEAGFSLIEMLVWLTLIGLLSSVIVLRLFTIESPQTKATSLLEDLNKQRRMAGIKGQVIGFSSDGDRYFFWQRLENSWQKGPVHQLSGINIQAFKISYNHTGLINKAGLIPAPQNEGFEKGLSSPRQMPDFYLMPAGGSIDFALKLEDGAQSLWLVPGQMGEFMVTPTDPFKADPFKPHNISF